MNLNVLGISVMVVITREWLSNPAIVAEINKHPLGAAIWTEIARIHARVSGFRGQRMSRQAALAELTGSIVRHSEIHDRKARALHNLLLFMAEASNDPALARTLRDLDALLFPEKLHILHLSYFEKAGTIIELEQRVTPEVIATLESLPLGDQTLADVYREWVAAGHALGRDAQQRARIEASLSATGSASPQTSARKVRSAWIRGVRLLLDSLHMLDLPAAARERLLAPLQKSVRNATLQRSPNREPNSEPESQPHDHTAIDRHGEAAAEPRRVIDDKTDGEIDLVTELEAALLPIIESGAIGPIIESDAWLAAAPDTERVGQPGAQRAGGNSSQRSGPVMTSQSSLGPAWPAMPSRVPDAPA